MNGKDRFSIPIRPAMAPFGIALSLLLSACANVAFDPGSTRLEEKALVFGRIQLDRDGETSIISVLSSPVVIRDIETGKEPGLITQAFEKDGRFHWALPPGRYQLSMVLHRYTDGVQSYAFNLDKAGTAYYFGDLTLHGKRRFDTLGGANLREIRPEFSDRFREDSDELIRRNPQLNPQAIEKLTLLDMTQATNRGAAYSDALTGKKPCCASLAELPYQALRMGESASVKIDRDSQVFDFPQGRSRFAAWQLPSRSATPYAIALRSNVTPGNMPGVGQLYIFSPAIMLLDENFKVLAQQEHGLFVAAPASVLPPRSASLQARIESSQIPASARYLIAYTTRSIIEKRWHTTAPGFIPIAGGVLPTGGYISLNMEPAISGEIEITLSEN